MLNNLKDCDLMNYVPEPVQFPWENIDDYVKNPDLKKMIEYDYLTFNFEEAVKKSFAFINERVLALESLGGPVDMLSVINPVTLDMKLRGALLLLQCESPESRMHAALHTFKFAEITLRLLEY